MLKKFLIDHLDSLGQGVSKQDSRVIFIPKTLPGEQGQCQVLEQKTKVAFARLNSLELASDKRIEPECIHYENCQGCHFLHTSYENEKNLKFNAYKRLYQKFNLKHEPSFISSSERFHYRSRIQLHYNKKQKKLGYFIDRGKKILEVKSCLLPNDNLQERLQELYQNQSWLELVKNEPEKGHIELDTRSLHPIVNQDYASLGFQQLNLEINQKILELIQRKEAQINPHQVVDLFGGQGNLTKNLTAKTWVVDIYSHQKPLANHQNFINLNLYSKKALLTFRKLWKQKTCDWLILDPPRSGLKNLREWLDLLRPKFVTYISCNPHTQIRDLSYIDNYKIDQLSFLDMFPGTHHLESMMHLSKKSL